MGGVFGRDFVQIFATFCQVESVFLLLFFKGNFTFQSSLISISPLPSLGPAWTQGRCDKPCRGEPRAQAWGLVLVQRVRQADKTMPPSPLGTRGIVGLGWAAECFPMPQHGEWIGLELEAGGPSLDTARWKTTTVSSGNR